eukprot:Em0001g307a
MQLRGPLRLCVLTISAVSTGSIKRDAQKFYNCISPLIFDIPVSQMFYLVFETVKYCMEVGDTDPSCEAAKHTCIVDRIVSGNIDNLEIHFERSTALVPSYLYPHLTGRCMIPFSVLVEIAFLRKYYSIPFFIRTDTMHQKYLRTTEVSGLMLALSVMKCTARELEWLCQKIGTQLTLELAQNRQAILACNRWTIIMREDWRRGNLPKIILGVVASTNS